MGTINLKKAMRWLIPIVIVIILLVSANGLVETTDAGFMKVKQAAITGKMTAYTEPGMFPQWFGNVTQFKEAGTVWFSKRVEEGGSDATVGAIEVRFNDGGTAKVSGSVRYTLSRDHGELINIKKKFQTDASLYHEGISQVVNETIILTAALMTSEQSYTARAQFSEMAKDQIENGKYLTETRIVEEKDPLSGKIQEKRIVVIKTDKDGNRLRDENPLAQYGIKFSQCVIKDIDYEKGVLELIEKKREYLMKTVAKMAEAENAVQERKTAEEIGKRNVVQKEYEALVLKKAAVIEAQRQKEVAETNAAQKLAVAELDKKSAAQEKEANILRGQGEAEYKRLVLEADGALKQKLATYEKVMGAWADAYAVRNVPTWNMPSGGNAAGNIGTDTEPTDLMGMLGLLVTKQVGLDMSIKTQQSAK